MYYVDVVCYPETKCTFNTVILFLILRCLMTYCQKGTFGNVLCVRSERKKPLTILNWQQPTIASCVHPCLKSFTSILYTVIIILCFPVYKYGNEPHAVLSHSLQLFLTCEHAAGIIDIKLRNYPHSTRRSI